MKNLAARKTPLAIFLAVLIAMGTVAPAIAAMTIYVTGVKPIYMGVGYARLTKTRSYNISKLGRRSYSTVDRNYTSQTVYLDCWGTRLTSGRNRGKYPLHMWSKKARDGYVRTFQFTCYSGYYVTTKGIRVGSYATALRRAYGTALVKRTTNTGTWDIYTLNSAYRWRTEFYVPRSGAGVNQVTQISIWTY